MIADFHPKAVFLSLTDGKTGDVTGSELEYALMQLFHWRKVWYDAPAVYGNT